MDLSYKYSTYYDWENDGYSEFALFLDKLCKKSLDNLVLDGVFNGKNFLKIEELVRGIEHFMVGLIKTGYVNKGNIEVIMDTLMKVDCVKITQNNNYYGVICKDTIWINPEISKSKTLANDERTILFLAHEIAHMYHNSWYLVIEKYLGKCLCIKDLSKIDPKVKRKFDIVLRGVTLLDEVISQDIAEAVAYCYSKKERPLMEVQKKENMFNGKGYLTNFDCYGELENVAVKFLRTILPLKSGVTDEEALKMYSVFSFSSNLASLIIECYEERNQSNLLIGMLTDMGMICDASYQAFGKNIIPLSGRLSSKYLDDFNFLYCEASNAINYGDRRSVKL